MKHSILKTVLVGTAILYGTTALTACTTSPAQDIASMTQTDAQITVSGEAFYRERIMFAPGSVLLATLTGDNYETVTETRRELKRGEMPISFSMSVPADRINPNTTYSIRVQVMDADGQLRWTAKDAYTLNPRTLSQDLGQVLLISAGSDVAASPGMGPNPDMMGSTVFTDADLLDRIYQIEDVSNMGIIDSSNLTIRFGSDGQISGSGGCNTYFASFRRDDTKLSFGPIGATQRACAEALMNQEQKFVTTINDVTHIERDIQGAMILKTDDGRTLRGFLKS